MSFEERLDLLADEECTLRDEARLKQLGGQARTQERSGNVIQAEATIKRLLPPVVGWLGV